MSTFKQSYKRLRRVKLCPYYLILMHVVVLNFQVYLSHMKMFAGFVYRR